MERAAPSPRPRTIGTVLLGLVIGIILPLLALAAAYGIWSVRMQQGVTDARLQKTASLLSMAVDREVQTIEALLTGLAASPSIDARDFAGFYRQAASVAKSYDGWVVLTEPSTQQVVNTLRAFGDPLPTSGSKDSIRTVVSQRERLTTDLFVGAVAKRHALAVIIPVIRGDTVPFTLDMAFYPSRISSLLNEQPLPPGWSAAIIDRNNVVIARTQAPDEQVGRPAEPWLVAAVEGAQQGVANGTASDGEEIHAAFRRSNRSGWTTVVAISGEVYRAPTRAAEFLLLAGTIISLSLAGAAAALIGRRIASPLRMLAQNADPLVRGERVSVPRAGIIEVNEVTSALIKAAGAMREAVESRIQLAEETRARKDAETANAEIRKREGALRASEERYRGLTEAIASVVWMTEADGRAVDMPQWRALTGQTAAQCEGWGWLDAVHPEDAGRTRAAWRQALEGTHVFDVECRVRTSDAPYHWFNARAVPVFDTSRSVREWVGVCIDINERKLAEERQALLMAELDHRVRNILASIQAMISLTAQSAPNKEEMGRRLQGRVAAMARTHGVLTRQKWKGASLTGIIRDELRPYADDEGAVALIGSPDCILRPREALNFALVIHELATNAAKYGALTVPGGRITVDWHIAENEGASRLVLDWRESGGPRVVPPTRRGFGSRLLESALGPDAQATLGFDPAGVRCRIEMYLQHGADAEVRPLERVDPPCTSDTPREDAENVRLLVAEDEPLAAMEIVDLIEGLGAHVVGPASTVAEAAALAASEALSGAILDINLDDELIFEVAAKLRARSVPVVFVSGYDNTVVPEDLKDVPTFEKPFDRARLEACLQELVGFFPRRELG